MSKKVLVVDDDASTLKLVESVLKSIGYTAIVTNNSKETLSHIKNHMPNLVLLDIIMPGMDGYKLCEEIKKLYKDKIPVIVFTSQSYEKELIEDAYKDFGADDYMVKPFDTQEFIKKIQKVAR